ncbi:hypothetical protein [Flavobacterium limi]|uniref:Uncharacterized protein n=1 Tax=Flavobacterium limi TaxID=2045105 RepID=A0ABQ1TRS0_9FLAO|nr:hypothetical protein [Flavobacterium limi]GGF01816.1 hypothetical protein GCM10011518_09020 [Flavobacterium limi]
MNRNEINQKRALDDFQLYQNIEKSLAYKLGIPEISSGIQVIRNENGWRENEKNIESIWIVLISRSFIGWGGIFSIKFNENNFREHLNPDELLQGIFLYDNTGIKDLYTEKLPNTPDEIVEIANFNLFDTGKGIPLNGISYNFHIITNNINASIKLNNPNTDDWKKWEEKIFDIGSKLSIKSNITELINLFEYNN